YLRLGGMSNQEFNLLAPHPLLDGIIYQVGWREIEPNKGEFDFSSLHQQIATWQPTGKKLVFNIIPYGQTPDDAHTPPWLYSQPGVRQIWFNGGGQADGAMIRTPAVWDPVFLQTYLEPMIAKLADEFDGHPAVNYIMVNFGHLGNLTAQPSAEGAEAYLAAGWTPELWAQYASQLTTTYQRYFKDTPLAIKATDILLRRPDPVNPNYQLEAVGIFNNLVSLGVAGWHFGLTSNDDQMSGLFSGLAPLLEPVNNGETRFGWGDDWPLYRPNQGQGEDFVVAALENAFGVAGTASISPTMFFLQMPDLLASASGHPSYSQAVFSALSSARNQAFANSQAFFGD
ncbi:MAG: beta-galactosidase, partial [Patescibacteria group bacterium]